MTKIATHGRVVQSKVIKIKCVTAETMVMHSVQDDLLFLFSLSSLASFPPPYVVPVSPFQLCRFVISVTGMMASEKR